MTRTTTLDTTSLAKLFLITPQWVRRLTEKGIFQRARDVDGKELQGRYELVVNLHAYIKYLKDLARLDDASESEYQRLRNMRMRHEAEMAALKLREIKGQVLKTSDVEFIMTNLITATKNHLLSIPSRVTRLLIGVTSFQVIFDLLQNEIEVALRELSQWRVGQFAAQRAAFLASQGANIADFPEPHTNGEVSDETTDDEASTDT